MVNRRCIICRSPLVLGKNGKRGQGKFCSHRCYLLSRIRERRECSEQHRKEYLKRNPQLLLPTATVGAIGEHRVITDLLIRGYDVFQSASPSCSCDLAILKGGKLLRIEVTTGKYSAKGRIFYPPHNPVNYDIIAVVLHDELHYFPDLPT